jgi:S1-C subfamily serine protease
MTTYIPKQILLSAALLAASAGVWAQDASSQAKAAADQARAAEKTAREAAATARATARESVDEERREMDQLREQMRELSRKMADLSTKVGDVGPREYAWRYIGNPDNGMIGVVLEAADKGLRVTAVTPGSAADKAGVRNNDIIVAVDGKSVAGEKSDRSLHGISLGDLKVDQTITLSVQRDGKTHDYTMKAERRDPYNFAYAFGEGLAPLAKLNGGNLLPPDYDKRVKEQTERAMREAQRVYAKAGENMKSLGNLRVFAPWWGVNLASLNADLGSYFGTDKGVLVLSSDDEDFKQLKAGDVLQQVSGKKVERPEDAFRLLREQTAGTEVKVEVLRQHKPLTLTLRAPESSSVFVIPPPPPAPPAPPAPPVSPVPAAPPAPPAPPAPRAPKSMSVTVIAPVPTVTETSAITISTEDDDSDGG